jgi:menaquinone-dependent protoporphyrinogen oxidase
MADILIVYGTTEGHTSEIVEHMREVLESRGHTVLIDQAGDGVAGIPDGIDGVIVGGAVHTGKQNGKVRQFVKDNRATLEAIPSAFFQVCLNAADPDPEVAAAGNQELLDAFVAETGWQPARTDTFAGMLAWTRYGFLKRLVMKRIVRTKVPPEELDTTRDVDYTDYAAVRRFAEEFAGDVGGDR